jgi:hypothetical protein
MSAIMHHKALTIALTIGLVAASVGAYPIERIAAGHLGIFQGASVTDTSTEDQGSAYVGTTPLIGNGDLEDDF